MHFTIFLTLLCLSFGLSSTALAGHGERPCPRDLALVEQIESHLEKTFETSPGFVSVGQGWKAYGFSNFMILFDNKSAAEKLLNVYPNGFYYGGTCPVWIGYPVPDTNENGDRYQWMK